MLFTIRQTYRIQKNQKDKIWKAISQHQKSKEKKSSWQSILKYAAILLLIGSVSLLINTIYLKNNSSFSLSDKNEEITLFSQQNPIIQIISPDNVKSTLALSDWIHYGIEYAKGTEIKFNKTKFEHTYSISTQIGQIQKVVSPDGSTIWLNANSELIIPKDFNRTDRKVILKGEAYFEVIHDHNKTFYVNTIKEQAEVLGTHFNILVQANQKTYTTLLEGSLKVSQKQKNIILKPGEQTYSDPELLKRTVNTEAIVSWKNGYFHFENNSIESILDQIKHWYNISFIKYDYKSEDSITGTFKRSNSLQELLNNLEELSTVKFEIKEGGIYVLKK